MHHALCLCAAVSAASLSAPALAVSIERVTFGGLTTLDYFGAINNRGDLLVRIDTPQSGDGLVVRAADGLLIDVGVGFRGHYTPGIADTGDVAYWGDAAQQPDMLVRRTFDYFNDRTLLERTGGGSSPSSAISRSGVIATTRAIDDNRTELLLFHPGNTITTPATFSGTEWEVTAMGPNGSVLVGNYQLTNVTVREVRPDGAQTTLYSGNYGTALDVNAHGQIVGAIRNFGPGEFHDGLTGAIWRSGEHPNPILLNPFDEGIGVSLNAINDEGVAIGSMFVEGDTDQYGIPPQVAVYWTERTGLRLVQDLLDPSSGWTVERVYDINDHNVIFGTGLYNGEQASFLLTIPNGATIVPLASLSLFAQRRRR